MGGNLKKVWVQMILVVGMGVVKDIVATVSNLAYWMAKERTTDSLRELSKLKRLLPDQAVEEAEETFDAMEMFLKEGQFDDAWEQFEVLSDIVVRYIEDPPLTTWLPEETYCLLYTSPSPRDLSTSRMPSSA